MTLATALSELLSILKRRGRVVISVFALLFGAAGVVIILIPANYVARTMVLAKFGREYLVHGMEPTTELTPSNFGQDDVVNSVIEIMKAPSLAAQVVREMSPIALYPDLADVDSEAIERVASLRFESALSIAPARHSNVIIVSFANRDPYLAANAVNRYMNAFQTKYLSLYGENSIAFLRKDLARIHGELAAAQAAMSAYEQDHRVYSQDEQIDGLIKRREDVDAQRDRVMACCAQTDAAAELTKQVSELDRHIAEVNASQGALRVLTRRRDLTQDSFDAALKRLQEAQVTRGMDEDRLSSVQVIEQAVPPTRPAGPGKLVKLFLALCFSGVASVAAGILAEVLSSGFATASHLREAFNVPVLADVLHWKSSQ